MLEVKDLTFGFGKKPLFQNVSFKVASGELARIEGPNGAGKSTLVSLIGGLLTGAEGNIKFEGPADFRTWTSWIAADANGLFPSLSAEANLRFWLSVRGLNVDTSAIRDHLTNWGIMGEWTQSNLPTAKFSTGMRRRLALSRLQLEATNLWLLDEPLFGLDDRAYMKFKTLLKNHLSNGGAAVLVTHDARLVDDIAHQTVRLGGDHGSS